MSDPKSIVEKLSKDGVSLHEIIMSGRYSDIVRVEALRVLHVNVRELGVIQKSVLSCKVLEDV